jgi:hypothetical protein
LGRSELPDGPANQPPMPASGLPFFLSVRQQWNQAL